MKSVEIFFLKIVKCSFYFSLKQIIIDKLNELIRNIKSNAEGIAGIYMRMLQLCPPLTY